MKHWQHASWLRNGLGQSSCEGIVQQCWILVENKGPLACQPPESAKKGDCGKTCKLVQVLFRGDVVEVDPPNHISISPEGGVAR